MTEPLTDKTGAAVYVTLDAERAINAYTVTLGDGTLAGRADFVDSKDTAGERVFFHTEVDPEFGGRGLGGLVMREALSDSARKNITVVPVCSMFAQHLQRHGDEYTAQGGRFRKPRPQDLALVHKTVKG